MSKRRAIRGGVYQNVLATEHYLTFYALCQINGMHQKSLGRVVQRVVRLSCAEKLEQVRA